MSLSKVWGVIPTIRSVPPRAPRWPASDTRTSYQVGKPWMLDGKMLRGAAGMPIRSTARANISLALAEPEPLTLAKRTTKSFTRLIGLAVDMKFPRGRFPERIFDCPKRRWASVQHTGRNAGRRPRPSPSRGQSLGRPERRDLD